MLSTSSKFFECIRATLNRSLKLHIESLFPEQNQEKKCKFVKPFPYINCTQIYLVCINDSTQLDLIKVHFAREFNSFAILFTTHVIAKPGKQHARPSICTPQSHQINRRKGIISTFITVRLARQSAHTTLRRSFRECTNKTRTLCFMLMSSVGSNIERASSFEYIYIYTQHIYAQACQACIFSSIVFCFRLSVFISAELYHTQQPQTNVFSDCN